MYDRAVSLLPTSSTPPRTESSPEQRRPYPLVQPFSDSHEPITDLEYADDVVLLAEVFDTLKDALLIFSRESSKLGLHINLSKTMLQSLSMWLSVPQQSIIGPQTVETTNNFTYLGCTISHNNSCNDNIKRRIAIATFTMSNLSSVWRSLRLSLKTKLRQYDSLVICVVTYSAASWILTKAQHLRIHAFNTKALRRILGIRWYDRVTNNDVYARTGQHPLTTTIRKRRLGAFGHICRLPPGTRASTTCHHQLPLLAASPWQTTPTLDRPNLWRNPMISHMMMLWPQPVRGQAGGQ